MKLHAFYHVYQTDGWEDMYMEQMHLLCVSGLSNELSSLTIGVVGDKPLPYLPTKNTSVVYHVGNSEETDTLILLNEFAKNTSDCGILYFHTKGVSHTDLFTNVSCWRRYMEYFVIFNWKLCIEMLSHGDAVGVNFDSHTYFGIKPHFSGGMWWARSSYINKLDHSFLMTDFRYDREFWIGSAITQGKPVTFVELHNSGLNNINGAKHYHQIYTPCEYVSKIIDAKLIHFNKGETFTDDSLFTQNE
jgi:hypothetical protein